ncbi:unnamed protein product [Candida verbasci]|uniref:Serine/threonine-protein phosphatase n=1 Tax=Candida verbasci TaxID=1227364 RepID=A0A9W4TRB5_9ASCO|nr:unnamed protein product [Candida verbasci]
MSSPTQTPRSRRKRQNEDRRLDDDDVLMNASSPIGNVQPSSPIMGSSPHQSQLPSSPAIPFDAVPDNEDEIDLQQDVQGLNNSDDESGDDLMENLERDYRANAEQDNYDLNDGNINDTEEFEEMDAASRRRIDEQLNRRDAILQNANRSRSGAFLDEGVDDEDDYMDGVNQLGLPIQRRRRRGNRDEDDESLDDDDIEIDPFNEELSLESLSDVKAPSITEWILQPAVSRSIARELKSFFLEFTDMNGDSVYGNKMRTLGEVNAESLEVSYKDLADSKAILALFLATTPAEMLKIFDIVAMEAVELHYPNYSQIHEEIHVRIIEFPTLMNLRDLREGNLKQLVRVSGVVTRRTGIFPQLKYVKFDCLKCGVVLGPFAQESNTEVKISFCTNCQSKGPFKPNAEKTLYRNYQRITLQEAPGSVPAGRIPRHREVILLSDLVDGAKPGEEIEIVGIYKNDYDGGLNARNGFPVFNTFIEANSIRRKENDSLMGGNNLSMWTEEEEREFRKLSQEKGIIDKIISSMAPSIYGHKDIKSSIACSLFGGVAKNVNGKLTIRGDINVLLMGDPGTAKSQILKYVEKTSSRAVFATGQGASAVGLTASVRKDPITREWTLEGGALVLADKGTCLIDEFDKMNDQDRTSIHEAMEQQSISVSKAGIVTTLHARCAIIAAANPNGGKYNSTLPLSQNVNLTEPILSRFDLLCVVRDLVNPEADERLANFVVDSHMRSHLIDEEDDEEENNSGSDLDEEAVVSSRTAKKSQLQKEKESEISPIPQDLLIKYIQYARMKIQPKLHQMDMDKVAKVYADLRKESLITGSFPITVRHLESILRIAESFAKMRLSDFVSQNDLNRAIKISIDSFVGTQKISVKKHLEAKFKKYTLPTRQRNIKLCKFIPESDVEELCSKVIELLISEANIQSIDAPVTICGDIHGQLHDLLTLFKTGGALPQTQYLFLGDFVDRGFYSLESFLLLLSYKLKYPDRITLIRGNHESRQITTVYGFYEECMRKYGNLNVWRYCCEVFDYLSLGAIIGNKVFCIHGGLSPDIYTIDQIRILDRKQEVPHEGGMCDLLWSDPDQDTNGWSISPRGAGFLFGENEVKKFQHLNGIDLIARAHQLVMEGYKEMFDSKLVTVWSAPNYCYRCGNVASVLTIDDALNRDYKVFEASNQDVNSMPLKKPPADYFI